MEDIRINTELFGDDILRISSKEFSENHMLAFKTNDEFNYLFYKDHTNKAFHIFGLDLLEINVYKKFKSSYYFRIIDSKLWFLTKIKYGI